MRARSKVSYLSARRSSLPKASTVTADNAICEIRIEGSPGTVIGLRRHETRIQDAGAEWVVRGVRLGSNGKIVLQVPRTDLILVSGRTRAPINLVRHGLQQVTVVV
jgi:hypothetical protein